MAIGANSYGDAGEIGALAPLYANGAENTFTTGTRPTLAQVESMCDQVSGIVNVLLAEEGFTIPVSQADAKLALDLFVNQEVANLVEYANGAGPFIPRNEHQRGVTPQRMILADAEAFIANHAVGLEKLGAARTSSQSYGLVCRTTDESGDALVHPFSVKEMGHSIVDWDTGG